MGEVILSTGTVVIDKSKVKHKEWVIFITSKGDDKSEAAFIEKVTGIKPVAQDEMLHEDFRLLMRAIVTAMTEPLADPNLPSPSTKD